jgi:molecular chaperone GrpE
LTKKNEPIKPATTEEKAAASEPTERTETVTGEPVTARNEASGAGEDVYTLTAEEFAAAKAHIESLQKEKDDTVLLLQHIQADFDNFRKRNANVRLDSYEEGKRDAIKELLPALDSFDRAVTSAGENCDKALLEGILLVQRQLLDSLKKLGLEEVEATGQFDPNYHEAVLREKAKGKTSGDVVEVLQKGYRVGEKVLRHTMVKVAE